MQSNHMYTFIHTNIKMIHQQVTVVIELWETFSVSHKIFYKYYVGLKNKIAILFILFSQKYLQKKIYITKFHFNLKKIIYQLYLFFKTNQIKAIE